MIERTHGPTHPAVAAYLSNMAMAACESGDLAAATEGFERAFAMQERNFGPGQWGSRDALFNRANTREMKGQVEEARVLGRTHVGRIRPTPRAGDVPGDRVEGLDFALVALRHT